MSRRLARETVFKVIFQCDITGDEPQAVIGDVIQEKLALEADREFARDLAVGIGDRLDMLDDILAPHLRKWHIKRLSAVDRSILRLALYEILFMENIPDAVSINEALELAKKYSDAKSASFVNGVLDKILKTVKEEGSGR